MGNAKLSFEVVGEDLKLDPGILRPLHVTLYAIALGSTTRQCSGDCQQAELLTSKVQLRVHDCTFTQSRRFAYRKEDDPNYPLRLKTPSLATCVADTMQARRDEILAKKAKLAELKRQRELRSTSATRQSIGGSSDVNISTKLDPPSTDAL